MQLPQQTWRRVDAFRAATLSALAILWVIGCAGGTATSAGADAGQDMIFGINPGTDVAHSDRAGQVGFDNGGSGHDGPGGADTRHLPDVPFGMDIAGIDFQNGFDVPFGGSDRAFDGPPGRDAEFADVPRVACDPSSVTSCSADQTCAIDQTGTSCSAFGTQTALGTCNFNMTNGGCARNLNCVQPPSGNAVCVSYCTPAEPDPCGPTTFCFGGVLNLPDTVGLCVPIDNCNVFDKNSCGSGKQCDPLDENAQNVIKSVCNPAQPLGLNADCTADPGACGPGLLCIGPMAGPFNCRPLCDRLASPNPCQSGTGACTQLFSFNTIGACL